MYFAGTVFPCIFPEQDRCRGNFVIISALKESEADYEAEYKGTFSERMYGKQMFSDSGDADHKGRGIAGCL